MLHKYKTKREEGFTIIEVLIVLAIAGLIMLIVFLAVPALQRNARNNARNQEASRISTAITECMANKNGTVSSCDNTNNAAGANGAVKLGIGTDNTHLTNYQQFDSVDFSTTLTIAPAGVANDGTTRPVIRFGVKCGDDGTQADGSNPSTRDFVVLYTREPASSSSTRCIGSQ